MKVFIFIILFSLVTTFFVVDGQKKIIKNIKELKILCKNYNGKMLNNTTCLIKEDGFIKEYSLLELKKRKKYNDLFK